ncbi:glycosyltransferase [Scytonema sp. NUACC21]
MLQNVAYPFCKDSRVLLLSLRDLKFHVSRSGAYEFEDIIYHCDNVDLLVPNVNSNLFKVTNTLANHTAKFLKNGKLVKSLVNYNFEVEKKYDLFFSFFQNIKDIIALNSIKGWREKCKYAVCWLDEIWVKDIDSWQAQLNLLKDFDYIFMNFSSSINKVANIIQRPCYSIPYGVDAVKFCPYPADLYRCIDVLNIGRRSAVTHNALIELVEQKKLFYIYDTIKDLYMTDYRYHRSLYTNFVKRSRYMIVNKAKFDLTDQSNAQEEIGPRFFEAAAGGTIMLGVSPKCEDFTKNLGWSNPVIEIPFDCPNIADIIYDLDMQPGLQEKIRVDNMINSLLRHDWVYRWEKILATTGLESTPQMRNRKAHLKNLAEIVSTQQSESSIVELVT